MSRSLTVPWTPEVEFVLLRETARHLRGPRRSPAICAECHEARALSLYRGRWARRPDHDLCPRCWRAWRNRTRGIC